MIEELLVINSCLIGLVLILVAFIINNLRKPIKGLNLSNSISKGLSNFFKTEENQQILSQSVLEALATLFGAEEFQKLFAAMIEAPMSNIMVKMTQPLGITPQSPEEISAMETKVDTALGNILVNGASSLLPAGSGIILDNVFPNWKENALQHPQEFIMLINKAKQKGLFEMLSGLNPFNNATSTSQNQTSTNVTKSNW